MNIHWSSCLVIGTFISLLVLPTDAWRRRRRRRSPPPNQPPRFVSCPVSWTIPTTSTLAVITWATPQAVDENSTPTVTQTTGPHPGASLGAGAHHVSYTARDSHGATAPPCSFTVTVDVIRCPSVPAASHRLHSCTYGVQGGSQCTFSCHHAFRLVGSATSHCVLTTRRWSASFPTCQAKVCNPPLSAPDHGSVSCSDGNRFMSLCTYHCEEGYEITSGQTSVRFCNGETWSGTQPLCQDIKPPVFTACPTSFDINIQSADSSSAVVDYNSPEAKDNSGHVTVSLVEGKASGSRFNSGANTIKYRAQDDTGNVIECNFTINLIIIVITG